MTIKLALELTAGMNALSLAPAVAEPKLQAPTSLVSEAAKDSAYVTTPAAVATVGAAQAEVPSDAKKRDWNVSFAPYIWAAGVEGDLQFPVSGVKVDIDRSFSDILGNLKFTFMGALDVEYNRFVGIADVVYLNTKAKADDIEHPLLNAGKVKAQTFVVSGALGYRIVDTGPMFFDVVAGLRHISLDVDVELTSPLGAFGANVSPSEVSPMVGGRARVPLGARWGVSLYGDVGIKSDLKWQLIGSLQYDLGKHWRAALGYRHMTIHQDRELSEIDLDLSGPILGLSYRF